MKGTGAIIGLAGIGVLAYLFFSNNNASANTNGSQGSGNSGTYTPNPNNYTSNYSFSDLFGNATTPANSTSTSDNPSIVTPTNNGWHPNYSNPISTTPQATYNGQTILFSNPIAKTSTPANSPLPAFNPSLVPKNTLGGNASGTSISSM